MKHRKQDTVLPSVAIKKGLIAAHEKLKQTESFEINSEKLAPSSSLLHRSGRLERIRAIPPAWAWRCSASEKMCCALVARITPCAQTASTVVDGSTGKKLPPVTNMPVRAQHERFDGRGCQATRCDQCTGGVCGSMALRRGEGQPEEKAMPGIPGKPGRRPG